MSSFDAYEMRISELEDACCAAELAAWSAQNDELESMLLLELPGELVAIYESRY